MAFGGSQVRRLPVWLDLPILAIAVVVSTLVMMYLGVQLETDRCLDAGGRIVSYGHDRMCVGAAGQVIPLAREPLTPLACALAAVLWVSMIAAATWAMLWYVRGRSGPTP